MQETWIYLIRDWKTGLTKIGFSGDPQARFNRLCKQDTLMPAKNDFQFVEAWFGTVSDESALHKLFAHKRIRGEWFDIDSEDLHEIEHYFFENVQFSTGKTGDQIYEESYQKYLSEIRQETKKQFIFARSFCY